MGILRFGPSGWRARVGEGFDRDNVLRIAFALGSVWAERAEGSTILVGYDTRRDSKRWARAAGEVIASCGMHVVVSDRPCPTPALAWTAAHDPACIGALSLTASEAPRDVGGIIVRGHDGGPVDEAFADEVERRVAASVPTDRAAAEIGDFVSAYADDLVAQTDIGLVSAWSPRVVLDPLYGAGVSVAREVLERVGCDVVAIHDEFSPDFRGLHPDAREPWVDECEQAVVACKADLGIVLDGDADRVAFVDGTGRLVSQHDTAPLCLEHLVHQRGARGRVVATLACSSRIRRQADALDLELTEVSVGMASLYREFVDGDVIMAADESGGLCVPRHLPERDGLLAALMIGELLAGTGEAIDEHIYMLEREQGALEYGTRDVRLDHAAMQRLRNMLPGMNPSTVAGMVPEQVRHACGLRLDFADDSWMLLRPSRTKPVARVYAEGNTRSELGKLLKAGERLARYVEE